MVLTAALALVVMLVVVGLCSACSEPLPTPRPWNVEIGEVVGWDVLEDEYFLPSAAQWQPVGEEVSSLVDLVNGAGRAGEPDAQQVPPEITVLLLLQDGSVFTVWIEAPNDPDSAQIQRGRGDGVPEEWADWPRIKAGGLREAAERLIRVRQEVGSSPVSAPSTTAARHHPGTGANLGTAPRFSLADVAYIEFRDGASGAPFAIRTPGWNAGELQMLLGRLADVHLTGAAARPLSGGMTLTVHLLDGGWALYGADDEEQRAFLSYAPAPPEGAEATIASLDIVYSDDLAGLLRSAGGVMLDETRWTGLDAEPPAELGFVLAYGVDAKNVMDTFSGTFTKDLVSYLAPSSATAALNLTDEEIAGIYREMRDIGHEDYPPDFRLASKPPPACTPFQSYYLLVGVAGSGSVLKEIRWDDSANDQRPEAQALHRLVERIRELIESKPEFKIMPPPRGGYA